MWMALGALQPHEKGHYKSVQPSYKRIAKTHRQEVAEDFISKAPENATIWVFTSIRQPFTREISLFFERIEGGMIPKETLLAMNTQELHEAFLEKRTPPSKFFQKAFYQATDVNCSAHPFLTEDGQLFVSNIKSGKHINVVVLLRLEDIGRWDDIMAEETPGWHTPHGQDSNKTWYVSVYKKFVETFKYPQDVIEEYLQDDAMQFYTNEERDAWVKLALGGTSKGTYKMYTESTERIYTTLGSKDYLLFDFLNDD